MFSHLWNEGWDGKTILFLLIFCVMLLPAAAFLEYEEYEQWQSFKTEHNCIVTAKESGRISTGIAPIIGGNGGFATVITSEPSKTGWLCDDGVTYWR